MEPTDAHNYLAALALDVAFEVHRLLGPGFTESVYEEAMCLELLARGIPFETQVVVPILFKQQVVGTTRLDIVVGGELILELKAVDHLAAVHVARLLSYLRATRLLLGLLINFNVRRLSQGIRRLVLSPNETTPNSSRVAMEPCARCGVASVASRSQVDPARLVAK